MRRLKIFTYLAIAAQVLSTGLAWVMNGDVISSIAIAVLIPLSFGAIGLAAVPVIPSQGMRSMLRVEATLLFLLSVAALVLAATTGSAATLRPPIAEEMLTIAAVISALLVATLCVGLWRTSYVSIAVAIVGGIAALGLIASSIDSIDLMVIAASRAAMILFLVLLAQSLSALDPDYADVS
jgi:hypothetical protein